MPTSIHRPVRRWRDILMAVLSIGVGAWLITYGQKEWRDESFYRVKTKLFGSKGMVLSDEIETGREMNRNRMIFGVIALGYGGYLTWSLVRRAKKGPNKSPEPTR